jgi:predicted  nucleic acid-binding Zn-ribbon protein
MSWLDRLLGRDPPEVQTERAKDKQALDDLHQSFKAVSERTKRLETELLRVNQALRERRQPR